MRSNKVQYLEGKVHSMRTMQLHEGIESAAIAELKTQCSVPKEADVVVLSIKAA